MHAVLRIRRTAGGRNIGVSAVRDALDVAMTVESTNRTWSNDVLLIGKVI